MTANRILQLNAVSTLACALGLLATRNWLPAHFGLGSPGMLDALALGLVVYAAALFAAAARRTSIARHCSRSPRDPNRCRLSVHALRPSEPSARESSPPQALDQVRTPPHQTPDEIAALVLDHEHDRALVQSEVPG